jgi:uncharacterized membrane protein YhfC
MEFILSVIFAIFTIWVGVMALFFPQKTRLYLEKMFSRKPTASESEIRWGMRIGGFIWILIGVSVLLVYCFGVRHLQGLI